MPAKAGWGIFGGFQDYLLIHKLSCLLEIRGQQTCDRPQESPLIIAKDIIKTQCGLLCRV